MRRYWRRGRAERLAPEARRGPWSRVVNALDGTPAAGALRKTIDEAWASPALPQRTKALVFAVVARALGCPHAAGEVEALAAESGLEPAELESIVTHLGAPSLSPVEAALVPFARVTARARPVQLQQRARALREALAPEQVVEVVGLCALANALCRLGVVAELT
jgi:alkylhydroperoxidase/carboxymuconolactone decarboxylase family protein YurZ